MELESFYKVVVHVVRTLYLSDTRKNNESLPQSGLSAKWELFTNCTDNMESKLVTYLNETTLRTVAVTYKPTVYCQSATGMVGCGCGFESAATN
jgi:hypothetical protein